MIWNKYKKYKWYWNRIENKNSIKYETNIINNLSNQEIELKNLKDFDINNFSFNYKVSQIIFSKKEN